MCGGTRPFAPTHTNPQFRSAEIEEGEGDGEGESGVRSKDEDYDESAAGVSVRFDVVNKRNNRNRAKDGRLLGE